jgi:uncharacterized protein (DUF111 family)
LIKKNRPGVVLSCLAKQDRIDAIIEIFFQETSTLGVRIQEMARQVLPRRFVSIVVHGGTVRMKVADVGAGWEKASPEYIDCKKIANRTGRPLKSIMEDAVSTYRQGLSKIRPATMRGRA